MSTAIKTDQIVTILGSRGKGKSTLLKYLINKYPQFIVWDLMWEHSSLGVVCHIPEQLNDVTIGRYAYIVYQPMKGDENEFEAVNDCVMSRMPNTAYIVEEADKFAHSRYCPPHFNEIVQRGRHSGIGLIGTARRIYRLNPDIPANSDHIFLFQTILPRDITYLKNIDPRLEQAKTLKPYEFLHYIATTGDVVKCPPLKIKKRTVKA